MKAGYKIEHINFSTLDNYASVHCYDGWNEVDIYYWYNIDIKNHSLGINCIGVWKIKKKH